MMQTQKVVSNFRQQNIIPTAMPLTATNPKLDEPPIISVSKIKNHKLHENIESPNCSANAS
jgi:flavin reductase (DIM6/NTAB) family NADH-FMN oxidoreductase RutF